MYPNLYYAFKDWFGVEWKALQIFNMFGLMVALSFVAAAIVLIKELKRKEKQGLLAPREEMITVGKPASPVELLVNGIIGFVFGYKLLGVLFSKPDNVNTQDYIFSTEGSFLGGIAVAVFLAGLKWYEKNKQKLATPEKRTVRIWPHDRVGDFTILALVFGILGAKVFDNLENWSDFIKDPIHKLFSPAGLTFYGGLIVAAIVICYYAVKKGVKLIHLLDSAAPALMLAYALGRIGCQVAGDGDWGVYNSAYVPDANGKIVKAASGDFEKKLSENTAYFINGAVPGDNGAMLPSHGQTFANLSEVPRISFSGPSFLPSWMFAYRYGKNVNADGVVIAGDKDEHNRILPLPVFPTPFYETVLGLILFFFLWGIRKKIKTAGILFSIYLFVNGIERYFVEKIRVNKVYDIFGLHPTQAQLIALLLALSGLVMFGVLMIRKNKVAD
jgi:phosphatidylglycerol---prolipoprotein diacylglyceryl transferase